MNIDRNAVVCALKAKEARDLFRKLGHRTITVDAIARLITQSKYRISEEDEKRAFHILNRAVSEGYIEESEKGFQKTQKGRQLSAASLMKRMDRKTADDMVSGIIERASRYNDEFPDNPDSLSSVTVFGSYCTTAPDLGDIDIIVRVERKPTYIEGEGIADYIEAIGKFCEKHGPANTCLSHVDELLFNINHI